jgi:2-oxoisovalerate dehydrogenase E2 component (dihydrolipoyl transacylase)
MAVGSVLISIEVEGAGNLKVGKPAPVRRKRRAPKVEAVVEANLPPLPHRARAGVPGPVVPASR